MHREVSQLGLRKHLKSYSFPKRDRESYRYLLMGLFDQYEETFQILNRALEMGTGPVK